MTFSRLNPGQTQDAGTKTLIVILHFGAIEDTLQCLESLKRAVVLPFDAFVVNNGPEDDVESILLAKHPGVFYHRASTDTGFAAGNNIGLRFSRQKGYRYSLLLNNDTVAEEDFLRPLVSLLEENSSIGMAGPAMYYYHNKGELWSCGGWVNQWSGSMAGETRLERLSSKPAEVDYLPGACILVRNSLLERIGLMPEEYFLGVEEADWAISAHRAGFKIVACPESTLLHKVGVSSRCAPELIYNGYRNRFLFLRRQFRPPARLFLMAGLLFRKLFTDGENRSLCFQAFADHCRHNAIQRDHLDRIKRLYTLPYAAKL